MKENEFNLVDDLYSHFGWASINTIFNNCLWFVNKLLAPLKSSNLVNYIPTISWSILLSKASFAFLLISMFSYWLQTTFKLHKETFFGKIPSLSMCAANITLAFLLLVRWIESGHFPLSNLYESLLFLSWSLTSMHLYLETTLDKKETRVPSSPIPTLPAYTDPVPLLRSQYQAPCTLRTEDKVCKASLGTGKELSKKMVEVGNAKCQQGLHTLHTEGKVRKVRRNGMVKSDTKIVSGLTLGAITSPLSLFTNAFATFSLPQEMQKATVLVPALQSNWLIMHVSVMIISYAALLSGSLLAMAFLASQFLENAQSLGNTTSTTFISNSKGDKSYFVNQSSTQEMDFNTLDRLKLQYSSISIFNGLRARAGEITNKLKSSWASIFSVLPASTIITNLYLSFASQRVKRWYGTAGNDACCTVRTLHTLPSVGKVCTEMVEVGNVGYANGLAGTDATGENGNNGSPLLGQKSLTHMLDNLSYRSIGLGFAFLTIGILSGAVWANEAWGSYWSWDPKETWAFVTWLVFAFYLHTRLSQGWVGKKSAYVAIFGFIIIWFCYLGVNLVGKGLHSYGWFQKGF